MPIWLMRSAFLGASARAKREARELRTGGLFAGLFSGNGVSVEWKSRGEGESHVKMTVASFLGESAQKRACGPFFQLCSICVLLNFFWRWYQISHQRLEKFLIHQPSELVALLAVTVLAHSWFAYTGVETKY